MKRAETYTAFLTNEQQRNHYTNDISELGKSIAENTRGAMAVYLRYNPDDFGSTSGFWYTINLADGSWQSSVPTDMSLYEKDDVEHVGWYYIPVEAGVPMWMNPYFNKNLGVEMISYIIPYYYEDYTIGIMGMDIDMSVLRESVSKIAVYETGRAFLLTKDGDIIYHENYKDGLSFDQLSESEKEYFENILKLKKDAINMYQSITGENEKLILKELRNGMILGIYVPTEQIRIPQRILVSQLFLMGIVILIIAIIICIIWVRTIIRPLKKMTAVAENYANGDYDEFMSVDTDDEVGKLSRSLQMMSNSLKQQIEIANSANEAKSNFLANMSHEIRTPINAVLGMNEMILRESNDDNIKNYAYDIHIAGQTLLSIINDILDMSKIESGKMEIVPVEYDAANLFRDIINMVSVKIAKTELSFKTEIDSDIPCTLFGDDVRIRQVLYNLLTNAVKYTKQGSVTLSIKCERLEDKVKLDFSVKDTGVGIAKEDIDKLFQAFVRIDEKKNRNIEGTGLGLNIVSLILKLMDSELNVDSVYGKGSDFYFTLYQPIIDARAIGDIEENVHEKSLEYSYDITGKIPDAKLLVVDDNAMNRKVFVRLLKDLDCVIDQAESGMECLKNIDDRKYDIIFMDHMMPEMDGIETFHRIRDKEGCINKNTPIIILTANAVAGAREQYMEEGFNDFLSKPIEPERLEKMVFQYVPDYKIFPAEYRQNIETVINGKELLAEQQGTVTDIPNDAVNSEGINDTAYQTKSEDALTDMAEELPAVEGADFTYALQKLRDVEILKSVIEDFSVTAEGEMSKLRDMYNTIKSGDESEAAFKEYRIQVHSMKSTAAMAGALNASSLARVLEYAARDEDIKTIDSVMDVFELEWLKMKTSFDKAFGLGGGDDDSDKASMDDETLKEHLDRLAEAIEVLDTDVADGIIEELQKHSFDDKGNRIVKELAVAVRNLDIEGVLAYIKEWVKHEG